jgi:hypothetical protein
MKNRVMLTVLSLVMGAFASQAVALPTLGRVVCDSHGTNCCVIFADGSAKC